MSLESYSSSSTNRLKSCCFLINFFEKVLYLAELDAREYYGIKLLQSIVIHPVKCMAMYVMNFFYLVTASFSLIEK